MHKNQKTKSTLIRWFVARLLCLTHLSISIFLLFSIKSVRHLFFIPIIALTLIILEIIVFCLLKFHFRYSFILLLIYSTFIISSIWLLELYRIAHLMYTIDNQASVEVFSVTYYAPLQPSGKFFLYNKYLWSQTQIQAYVFIIIILKGLCETKTHRLNIIIKTWTTALDVLDFIDLLSHPKLISDIHFVYITLSIWSISCLQFMIQISTIKKFLMKKGCHHLASLMTDSLLSVIITDIPYLIIRLYAIFGVKNHNYTSYFLVVKNMVLITIQIADTWITFKENTPRKRKPISV